MPCGGSVVVLYIIGNQGTLKGLSVYNSHENHCVDPDRTKPLSVLRYLGSPVAHPLPRLQARHFAS